MKHGNVGWVTDRARALKFWHTPLVFSRSLNQRADLWKILDAVSDFDCDFDWARHKRAMRRFLHPQVSFGGWKSTHLLFEEENFGAQRVVFNVWRPMDISGIHVKNLKGVNNCLQDNRFLFSTPRTVQQCGPPDLRQSPHRPTGTMQGICVHFGWAHSISGMGMGSPCTSIVEV